MKIESILHGRFTKSYIETKLSENQVYYHCKANFALRMDHYINEHIRANGFADSGLSPGDFFIDGKDSEAFYGALRGGQRMLLVVFKTFCNPVNWRSRKNICYNLTYPSTPDVEKSPRHTQSNVWLANVEGANEKLQVWIEARAAEIIELLVNNGASIPDDFDLDCECEFLDFIKPVEGPVPFFGRLFGKAQNLSNKPDFKRTENSKHIHFGPEWVRRMRKDFILKKEASERENARIEAEVKKQEAVEIKTKYVPPDSKDLPWTH